MNMKRLIPLIIIFFIYTNVIAQLGSVNGVAVKEDAIIATETLYVSTNGDNSNGVSWDKAYNTIQAALDAASTDADDLTLILISPHATQYDIVTDGDPTWTGNYILKGSHRNWAKIVNTGGGGSPTSIMKFTGKVALEDLNFNLGSGSCNGIIMTHGGFRVDRCMFVGESLTGAATALWFDGASVIKHGKVRDCDFVGHSTYMTALLVDNVTNSQFKNISFHSCLTAIQVVNADSDDNTFMNLDIGECAIGFDLDTGNEQHINNVFVHHNTTNFDDEVGDHHLQDIKGEFNMDTLPDDLTGVSVTAHNDAGSWGADVEVRAAATSTKPFKIAGYIFVPAITQKHKIRFTADNGATYFDEVFVEQTKNTGSDAGSDTDFIFNIGTQIKASVKAESGGEDIVYVWLKVQVM